MAGYYDSKKNIDEYLKLSEGVSGEAIINTLRKYLPVGSDVLELGSGPGTDWRILKQFYNVTGSDISDEFLNHLHRSNPNSSFLQLDATNINTTSSFDAIYSNKVLHHLTDNELQRSNVRQFEVLNHGGSVCHSFWVGEGDEIFKGMYVNYHLKAELMQLFSEQFEIVHAAIYKEFEEADSVFIIAKKRD